VARTIVVDDDVFEALQGEAEPLIDDVNSVLRRILGLETRAEVVDLRFEGPAAKRLGRRRTRRKSRSGSPRAARGTLLPESEYEMPLLETLAQHGGRAPSSEAIDAVGRILDERLKDLLPSGEIRWRNRTQFVRLRLTQTGDLVKGSPRGIWEISDQGRQRLQARKTGDAT